MSNLTPPMPSHLHLLFRIALIVPLAAVLVLLWPSLQNQPSTSALTLALCVIPNAMLYGSAWFSRQRGFQLICACSALLIAGLYATFAFIDGGATILFLAIYASVLALFSMVIAAVIRLVKRAMRAKATHS